jgi:c-di-GMP-binding flagellar brake protein YcgR
VDIFSLTQKVDVFVDDPETGQRRIYFSRIEDLSDDSLTIGAPYRRGFYLPPWPGREISARVTTNNSAYLFKAKLSRYVTEPIPLWVINRPSEISKLQMRSHVRLDIVLDIKLEILDDTLLEENRVLNTLTRDLSAGGLRAVFNRPGHPDTKVKITLPLPNGVVIEATGQIIRITPPDIPGDRQTAAIEFTDISERMRGQIVKFIFRKEVERRQKEKELFEDQ